jgi:rRNA methylase, putative, group 2
MDISLEEFILSFHIVLVEPEIPQNTGNIARTCAATNTTLHLVKPLGFSIDEKSVRRAGLDYWRYVDVVVHGSLMAFLGEFPNARMFLSTTHGDRIYTDFKYKDGDMFLFGRETAGLPQELISENRDSAIRIPMSENTRLRSLNLANSVNIVLFEALRQNGFPELL